MSPIEVHRIDPGRIDDFFALHDQEPFDWCYCVAWEVPTWDRWGERTAKENRALRQSLLAAGVLDGYLAYAGGRVVGWLQVGPRDRWPKLVTQYRLTPDPGAFAVGCVAVLPAFRRKGIAHRLLGEALGDLGRRGIARVYAFPRTGEHPDGEVWTGPETLYTRAGFTPSAAPWVDPTRPVYVRELDAGPLR